jgi:hypothetical protein
LALLYARDGGHIEQGRCGRLPNTALVVLAMSRGLGKVERRLLEILERHPRTRFDAYTLTVLVYNLNPDEHGWWTIWEVAQIVAVRRALRVLAAKQKIKQTGLGRVILDAHHYAHGRRFWLGRAWGSLACPDKHRDCEHIAESDLFKCFYPSPGREPHETLKDQISVSTEDHVTMARNT